MIITLEAWTGMSLSITPPCMVWPRAVWCFLAVFTPSTMTWSFLRGKTWEMRDSLPASLPEITITLSPSRSLIHKTSGASETMRMKRLSRSSRATGPKMRVPRGWRLASMITQALSSKRI